MPQNFKIKQMNNPESWVNEYGNLLYHFALVRVQDKGVAEDLVQETLLAALKDLHHFKGLSSEKTWLLGILKHKTMDYFRRKNREIPVEDMDAAGGDAFGWFDVKGRWKDRPPKWKTDPSDLYEQSEFMKIFNHCRAGLSARLSVAFTLREIDGLSTKEICKVLNITANNLWVSLYRARNGMKHCLNRKWFMKG